MIFNSKTLFFSLFFLLFFQYSNAQNNEETRKELKNTVDKFFAALHDADSALMGKVLHPSCVIKTAHNGVVSSTPYNTFLMAIGTKPRPNVWLEKLYSYEIKSDDNLATVWTEYSFFLDGNLSHCGYNHFVLAKEKGSDWKIHYIIDTRHSNGCLTKEERSEVEKIAIDTMMNRWHKAAATADELVFFDSSMTADAIYLGTDITERWLRDELKHWAKKAFEKDVAWAFTPKRRSVYFDENDMLIAWLEEDLDTWMGPCRGSAVLKKIDGQWKIKHYNLAVAVANDNIEKYLKILGIKKQK